MFSAILELYCLLLDYLPLDPWMTRCVRFIPQIQGGLVCPIWVFLWTETLWLYLLHYPGKASETLLVHKCQFPVLQMLPLAIVWRWTEDLLFTVQATEWHPQVAHPLFPWVVLHLRLSLICKCHVECRKWGKHGGDQVSPPCDEKLWNTQLIWLGLDKNNCA